MKWDYDKLTELIIECIINVHQYHGPGFLESIYRKSLAIEQEKEIRIFHEGEEVGIHRLDIIVEDTIIVELKTVEDLNRKHYAQLRSYLKAANRTTGILVNFASAKADFRRVEIEPEAVSPSSP